MRLIHGRRSPSWSHNIQYSLILAGMGDEGTSTHVLTKSDKSKQRSSKSKAPNQEIKWREPAKRFHVEENQSLDVVMSFAESISANFTVLTESMTNMQLSETWREFKLDER